MALQFSLLGEFQLSNAGADARPRGRKARGLLAFLAVAQEQTASRERVADLLWSDRGTEQARGSLRQTLAEIRSGDDALRDAIRISRDAVAFAPGHIEVDIDQILDAARRRDASGLAASLEHADTFLVDLSSLSPAYDEWLQVERTRQVDRVVAAGTAAVPAMIGVAQTMDIHAILRSLDRLDPWNETIARLGLEADHAAGDIASLHKRYKRLIEGLQREFGVRPSHETVELFERLTSAPRPASAPVVDAMQTAPPMILVSPITVIGEDPVAIELAAIVTDDIRTALTHHADLRVLNVSDADLGRVEQVCRDSISAYMLSGRIRRLGDDVRINLQLGSVGSGAVIWSEQLKVDVANIGGAVDVVVERAVGVALPAIDRDLATRVHLSDFKRQDSVTLYVKARRLIGRGLDLAETRAGVALLEEVVAAEPRHIGARMLLARMYNTDFWQRIAGHDVEQFRARALALAEEAAALAPTDGRIQLRLAWCHLRRRDWARAERELASAEAQLTYDADGLNECAQGYMLLGDLDRAEALMQRAFRLNPFAPSDYHADCALYRMHRGDAVAAEEHFDVSGEQGPLYLCARLSNLAQLPGKDVERARLRDDFVAAFARAWQPDRPAELADVFAWFDSIHPLRRSEHVERVRAGLRAALGDDWQATKHSAP